jgi:hypothetical protein
MERTSARLSCGGSILQAVAPPASVKHLAEPATGRHTGSAAHLHRTGWRHPVEAAATRLTTSNGSSSWRPTRATSHEISLTSAEVERASKDEDRWFLAVVGGLETDQMIVRVFAHPLRSLDLASSGWLRLGGVRTREALEWPSDKRMTRYRNSRISLSQRRRFAGDAR